MTTPSGDPSRMQISQVARWRLARNLIAVYAEIARKTRVSSPPSTGISADDRPEALDAIEKWFDSVDGSLSAAKFRAALTAMTVNNGESSLYAVAQHFMAKRRLDEESRKKIEFVLVQYFLASSPPSFHSKAISSREVAEVLHPLLGTVLRTATESASELEPLAARLQDCASLRDLYEIATALESCKRAMGDAYYDPATLVQITHAHYLFRLAARTMLPSAVAQLTRQLEELRGRGVSVLDCRTAGLSEHEPVDGLILSWKSVGEDGIEFRVQELAPALLAMEKVLAGGTGANPQLSEEVASLRALAEKLSAQLAAISQRVQRLEILIPAPGSTASLEPPKWRPAPLPPLVAPTLPIAMRTATATPPDAVPVRPPADVRPASPVPHNGKPHTGTT